MGKIGFNLIYFPQKNILGYASECRCGIRVRCCHFSTVF